MNIMEPLPLVLFIMLVIAIGIIVWTCDRI